MDSVDFRAHYGPWAIVAGASQGLGAEFARHLSAAGLNTVLVARSADKLSALAALGHHPTVVPGRMNHLLSIIMQHALTRRAAIGIMGRTLRRMYASRVQA